MSIPQPTSQHPAMQVTGTNFQSRIDYDFAMQQKFDNTAHEMEL
jgi:hypothetical protein